MNVIVEILILLCFFGGDDARITVIVVGLGFRWFYLSLEACLIGLFLLILPNIYNLSPMSTRLLINLPRSPPLQLVRN